MTDGKIKLSALPPSANSACVRSFLAVTGIEFAEENVWGQTRTPEYIAKFPSNLAPGIEHGDVCVSEGAAILRYLTKAFPEQAGKYYPSDDPKKCALIDMIMDMVNTGVCGLIPKAIYPTLGFPCYAGDVATLADLKEHVPASQKAAADALNEYMVDKVAGILLKDTKFLLSDEPTIADFKFAPMLAQIKVAIKLPEELVKYEEAMKELPGYADAIKPSDDCCKAQWK